MPMFTALLSLILLVGIPGSQSTLTGSVHSTDSVAAIPNATIVIYSAAPAAKDQQTPPPPNGYPEIGKSTPSDTQGHFIFAGVDPSLNYELLVLADGYRPLMLKKVDPSRGEITARLKPIPKDLQPELQLKGHVVDDDGKPVVGARIEPFGMQDGPNREWGGQGYVIGDGITYTDPKGNWLLIATKANVQIDIRVTGRGIAPTNFPLQAVGDQVNEMTVGPGATITGRIVKDGKGVPNLPVKLQQKNRGVENYVGGAETVTDADGKFVAHDLKPDDDYYACATMKGLAGIGAMDLNDCRTGEPGTSTDAGDLTVEKGLHVTGQIFCSDGKRVPPGSKVRLERNELNDSIETTIDKDGKFEFKGLPDALMEFWIDVHGYHLSDSNISFEPSNANMLLGKIDQDITDLRVQLDPGPNIEHNWNSNKWDQLQSSELTGVTDK
jgi:hypothetical protein